jgi:hypothetical protein
MKTEMIKEQLINVSANADLIMALFAEIEEAEQYDYAYAVYLEDPQPLLITGHLFHADGREKQLLRPGKGFKEFLEAHKPRSFADTLFLLHMFPHEDFAHYRFGDHPIISDILRESRGFLLWHYQLENLFRLFYLNNDEVVDLRKAINAKKNAIYELSRTLAVGQVSLYEVVKERMVLGITSFPNMRGACNMYNAIFSR